MTISHYYPQDLAAALLQRWPTEAPPLPPAAVLTQFFSVLYQASLLFEEGRPVECHAVLASPAQLAELKADLERQYGIRVTYLAIDLAAPGQAAAVYQYCRDHQVPVDYLVNNTGYGSYKDVAQEDASLYEDMLALNVVALTTLSTLVAREMVARQQGHILNVGSTSAYQPVPHMAVYGASKSYVLHFTEALHAELQGTGVTATVLSPGVTATGFVARAAMSHWSQAQGKLLVASAVAQAGYQAMRQGKLNVVPGWKNKVLAWSIGLVPSRRLKLAMSARFMRAA